MDYTQFYCYECKHFNYGAMGNGECNHPDVMRPIGQYCKACFRFKDFRDK